MSKRCPCSCSVSASSKMSSVACTASPPPFCRQRPRSQHSMHSMKSNEEFSWKKASCLPHVCNWLKPWSKDFPGMKRQSRLGCRSANPRPIGFVSACVKGASKRCVKAGMGTQRKCEAKYVSFWKKRVGRLLIHQATRFKYGLPSGLLSRSVLAKSIGFVPLWASAIRRNGPKKTERSHPGAGVARGSGGSAVAGCCSRNRAPLPVGRSPVDEAAQLECASALTTPSLSPATQPLAHALVSACGRTPPVLGFTQLYRTGARLTDRPTTPLQLSSYRTLPADAGCRSSRSNTDRSPGAVDGGRVAGGGKEWRNILTSFLRGWASETCLH